jgi:hypothetical protein
MKEEVFKSRYGSMQAGVLLDVDLAIFELLGYSIEENQYAIVLLAEKKTTGFDCIDYLQVRHGSVEYGAGDRTVYRKLTVDEFRELVKVLNVNS